MRAETLIIQNLHKEIKEQINAWIKNCVEIAKIKDAALAEKKSELRSLNAKLLTKSKKVIDTQDKVKELEVRVKELTEALENLLEDSDGIASQDVIQQAKALLPGANETITCPYCETVYQKGQDHKCFQQVEESENG